MNPNVCTMCEMHFTKIIRLKRWGEEQITIPATVLFADVRGYTRLSDLLDPLQIAQILRDFYEHCATAIWVKDGVINKLLGDGVLALFNWPVSHEDHARQATLAAMELQKRWLESKQSVDMLDGDDVSIGLGVGIHMGDVTLGDLSEFCRDYTYTAFGPVVNFAARLQGCARPGEILVTEDIYRSVRRDFPQAEPRTCDLKGIEGPVNAFVLHV
jgi:class 3 adenylate cyclase